MIQFSRGAFQFLIQFCDPFFSCAPPSRNAQNGRPQKIGSPPGAFQFLIFRPHRKIGSRVFGPVFEPHLEPWNRKLDHEIGAQIGSRIWWLVWDLAGLESGPRFRLQWNGRPLSRALCSSYWLRLLFTFWSSCGSQVSVPGLCSCSGRPSIFICGN